MAISALCAHTCSLCISSFSYKDTSHWTQASPLWPHLNLITSLGPISKYSHAGVRASTCELWETVQSTVLGLIKTHVVTLTNQQLFCLLSGCDHHHDLAVFLRGPACSYSNKFNSNRIVERGCDSQHTLGLGKD